jgi:hypothetical protein
VVCEVMCPEGDERVETKERPGGAQNCEVGPLALSFDAEMGMSVLDEWATYCPSTLPFRSNDQIPISSTSRLMLSGDSLALCARGAVLRGATAKWVAFVLSGVDDGTGGGTDRNVAKATTDSCHSARPSSFGDAVSVLVGFHRLGGKSRCGGKN